jgi:hypothetical protein
LNFFEIQKKKYSCHLPRCSVPRDIAIFGSYEELIKHIESSHMNRVPLVCPLSSMSIFFMKNSC